MTAPTLSPQQADNHVILLARRVATKHWSSGAGPCPVCGVPRCDPYQLATEVLQRNSRPPAPILRTTAGAASGPTADTQTPSRPAASVGRRPGRAHHGAENDSPHSTTIGGSSC